MPAAEHRRAGSGVALAVIAAEEPAFLMPMERFVGGIEIVGDMLGWRLARLQEQRNQMRLDGLSESKAIL